MDRTGTVAPFGAILRQGRLIASFALAGSVFAGLTLGWVPALAALNVNAIGAGLGLFAGMVVSVRHLA